MSDSLQPHGLQHAWLPCPSLSPRVFSDSRPLSQWCYLTISSSATPLSFSFQSFPASGVFQWLGSLHQVARYWSFSFGISPSNEYSGLISFKTDWFDLLPEFFFFFFFSVVQESSSSGENGEANTLRHYNFKTKQNLSQSVCFLLLNLLQQLLLSLLRPFKLFYFPTCSWLHFYLICFTCLFWTSLHVWYLCLSVLNLNLLEKKTLTGPAWLNWIH